MCYVHGCDPGPMFPEDETKAAQERVAAKRAGRRRTMSRFDGYKFRAWGDDNTLKVEVGPVDMEKGGLQFGMVAEVYRHKVWGVTQRVSEGEMLAEVSQSSIGPTSTEIARQRVASYEAAVMLAEFLNNAGDLIPNMTASEMVNDKDVDTVFKAFLLKEDPERYRVRA